MIRIKKAPKDYILPGVKWLVVGRFLTDACDNFGDALCCFFWRLGIPARIAFRKYKKK